MVASSACWPRSFTWDRPWFSQSTNVQQVGKHDYPSCSLSDCKGFCGSFSRFVCRASRGHCPGFWRYGGCRARPSATGSVQRFSCKPDSSENRHTGVYNMEMPTNLPMNSDVMQCLTGDFSFDDLMILFNFEQNSMIAVLTWYTLLRIRQLKIFLTERRRKSVAYSSRKPSGILVRRS